jgi:hypothetical protein
MKNLLFIVPLIALVLVSGCASKESVTGELTNTPEAGAIQSLQEKITTGMTAETLKGIAGEPGQIQKLSSDFEYWYYSEGSDVLQVAISNGKVVAEHFY